MFRDKKEYVLRDNLDDVVFQVVDFHAEDRKNKNYTKMYDDSGKEICTDPEYLYEIKLFGIDELNNTISVNVTRFKPYFYIELPMKIGEDILESLLKDLQKLMGKKIKNEFNIEQCQVVEAFRFKGFQWNKKKPFLKLSFHSQRAFRMMARTLEEEVLLDSNPFYLTTPYYKFNLYESNVEPILRFIHSQNLNASGWVRIPAQKYKRLQQKDTNCLNNLEVTCRNVMFEDRETIGKILIASFDIEADSSHGDFPVAKKDYSKTVTEMLDMIKNIMMSDNKLKVSDLIKYFNRCFGESTDPQKVYTKHNKVPGEECIMEVSEVIMKKIMNLKINRDVIQDKSLWKKKKEKLFYELLNVCNKSFPQVEGDRVIQIGTVLHCYGDTVPVKKHIITLGSCAPIDGVEVVSCETERELLLTWKNYIKSVGPEIITGYNIFGFDYKFMLQRCEELLCANDFKDISKLIGYKSELVEKKLSSSGLGDNMLYYLDMKGSIQIDLLKVVQRDHKLTSYKLDSVAGTFIHGKIKKIVDNVLHTDNTYGLNVGDFLHLYMITSVGEEAIENNRKFKVVELTKDSITVDTSITSEQKTNLQWGLAKDDISPNDIFRLQKGTSEDRALIAKYCIQDCALVLQLMFKLDIIPNNMGMSKVCYVPLQYIFIRGQGIKTYSLMLYECTNNRYVIPFIPKEKENEDEEVMSDYDSDDDDGVKPDLPEKVREGYEGAIVLPPKPKIYLDEPISVLDYASLYPSSMISENISHDMIVLEKEFLTEAGGKKINSLGYEYVDVTYDNYLYYSKGTQTKKVINEECPTITCRYIQPPKDQDGQIKDEGRGIVPRILMKLLKARKDTRKKMAKEEDPFKISVLDGLQLAYKVTANSIYGSIGAPTNTIYFKDIAASTTAVGRKMLYLAKDYVEANYKDAEAVYGDTDSIFINFHPKDEHGNPLKGIEALKKSIALGKDAGEKIKPLLKKPHDLEYEKTFWPFILFSKKRYVGNKYEDNHEKYKLTSMGIVLKRRDNAPILKYIYGDVIDVILNKKDVNESIESLKLNLGKFLKGEFPLDYLIITKSLKSRYENPEQIVHKALADRIAERDPGNKPQPNDRIPYIYIETDKKVSLQGDKVEHPDYIKKHDLKPDYIFYITNQIMKPICKIYSLVLEDLEGYSRHKLFYEKRFEELLQEKKDEEKAKKKLEDERMKDVEKLLFEPILKTPMRIQKNKREGNQEISKWFKPI